MNRTLDTNTFYSDRENNISSEHYSIVVGFFRKVFTTVNTAESFAVDLFKVAKSTDVSVLTLLDAMQDKDSIGVSEIMAFYLNQIRSQSELLGVQNIIVPTQHIVRNILM